MEEKTTIAKKGSWESINKVKDLLICPICRESNLNYYKSTKTRSHKSCSCGCKIYEIKDHIWFTIPDKKIIEVPEDDKKFEKYMMSKN